MKDDLIVVCGGTGFVGRAKINRLIEQGYTNIRSISSRFEEPWKRDDRGIELLRADLRIAPEAIGAVEGARFVYNLAATCVGGIGFIKQNRANSMMSSMINMNLLLACERTGVSKYFLSSSACVYPSNDFPIAESYAYPSAPEPGYGESKLFDEQVCKAFREEKNVETRVGRYFGVYGPGDNKGKNDHLVTALCKKIVTAKLLFHDSIEIHGDGNQKRGLLYIDDAVEGSTRLMNSGYAGPVNLGSAEGVTVNQICDRLDIISGTAFKRIHTSHSLTGVRCRYSDNTLCRRELGWEPSFPLMTGLERTYRWVYDKLLRELK